MLSQNLNSAILHISTYPEGIFKGFVRLVLYTVVPVGIVTYLPLRVILDFNLTTLFIVVSFTIILVALAFIIFYRGLRRYSSGNLMISRI
jgi:ABC-2 type transport system permease protein